MFFEKGQLSDGPVPGGSGHAAFFVMVTSVPELQTAAVQGSARPFKSLVPTAAMVAQAQRAGCLREEGICRVLACEEAS